MARNPEAAPATLYRDPETDLLMLDGEVIDASGLTDAMVYKGGVDCSTNPNYPAGNAGDFYKVTVAGKIGGASGHVVAVGDTFVCNEDGTTAGTEAQKGSKWDHYPAPIAAYPAGTKFYHATLTQSSTSAPVATVGMNTLGQTVTPARTSAGVYTLTAGGAVFTANKTQIFAGSGNDNAGITALRYIRTSTTVITLTTRNVDVAVGTDALEDDLLTETAIAIVVLP